MKRQFIFAVSVLISTLFVGSALAQELIIYPKKGQSKEVMGKDKYECYQWAKKETGFDPMEIPKATAPAPKQEAKKGGVVRGAAGGAAVGAIIDGGEGAGKGAAAGALIGAVRRRRQEKEHTQKEQQWANEQTSQYAQKRNKYNRAYAACLESKGYTVK